LNTKNDIYSYVNKHKNYWLSLPNVTSIFIENGDTIVVIVNKDVIRIADVLKSEFLIRVKLRNKGS